MRKQECGLFKDLNQGKVHDSAKSNIRESGEFIQMNRAAMMGSGVDMAGRQALGLMDFNPGAESEGRRVS